jgi:ribonuclease T
VLAKAAQVCGVTWDSSAAHSAKYDAERTADIFCEVCNALDGVWRKADVRAQALWGSPAEEAVPGGENRDGEIVPPPAA